MEFKVNTLNFAIDLCVTLFVMEFRPLTDLPADLTGTLGDLDLRPWVLKFPACTILSDILSLSLASLTLAFL